MVPNGEEGISSQPLKELRGYCIMNELMENCNSKKDLFWVVFDTIKRDFYDLIRNRIEDFDFEDPQKCMEGFEALFNEIKHRWDLLEKKIGKSKNLRGLLYEILFFVMAKREFEFSTKGLKILEFGSDGSENSNDFFCDVLPIYEPIPELLKNKVPKMRADFVIFCTRHNPSLVEVKSSKPKRLSSNIEWTNIGCIWHNCYYFLAYPKKDVDFPKDIGSWVFERMDVQKTTENKD
jgi:hypothetical protein